MLKKQQQKELLPLSKQIIIMKSENYAFLGNLHEQIFTQFKQINNSLYDTIHFNTTQFTSSLTYAQQLNAARQKLPF